MQRKTKNRITMGLLVAAMLLISWPAVRNSVPSNHEEQYLVDHAIDLSSTELRSRINNLRERSRRVSEATTPDEYFGMLEESYVLQYAAQKLEQRWRAEGNTTERVNASSLFYSLGGIRNQAVEYHTLRRKETAAQQAAFSAARDRYDERGRTARLAMSAALGEGMSVSAFLTMWLRALLGCIPFAMCFVALRLRNRGLSWKQVALEFASDWRPWLASCFGPIGPCVFPQGSREYDFRGTLRIVTYALSALVSCFTGGVGAVVVKAQAPSKAKKSRVVAVTPSALQQATANAGSEPVKPAPKRRWNALLHFRFTEANMGRANQQPNGLARLTLTSPSGRTWVESHVIFGRSFVTSEAYGGHYLVDRKTSFFDKLRFSPLGGVSMTETRHTPKRVASYRALAGARFLLAKGRVSIFSPFTQAEVPLNDRAKLSIVSVLRTSFRFTKHFSAVQETSVRGTRGAKPTSGYVGLFGLFQTSPRLTFEVGPTLGQNRAIGFRTAAIVSF